MREQIHLSESILTRSKKNKIFKHITTARLLLLSFIILILIGTLLLMLPFSTKSGKSIGFRYLRSRVNRYSDRGDFFRIRTNRHSTSYSNRRSGIHDDNFVFLLHARKKTDFEKKTEHERRDAANKHGKT